jgi:hypothetical protein
MVNSRYLMSGAPTTCAHCKQPFPVVKGQVEVWRSATGDHFCNEFCAEDAEEASFKYHRRHRDRCPGDASDGVAGDDTTTAAARN